MVIKTDRKMGNYTEISNIVLHDENLHLGAKALFCICVSEKQDGWNWSESGVAKRCHITRGTAATYLQELQEHGYLYRVKQEQKGKFGKNQYSYVFYERPYLEVGAFEMPDNVNLSQADYDSLVKRFGNDTVHDFIGTLSQLKRDRGEDALRGHTDFEMLEGTLIKRAAGQ
ncbi:MAG: hypothetical protein LUF28_08205 [Clostridiales bacterium]|nr:hypothetical protein [Clostridiales bacterium]